MNWCFHYNFSLNLEISNVAAKPTIRAASAAPPSNTA